jgi:hypothetical protein
MRMSFRAPSALGVPRPRSRAPPSRFSNGYAIETVKVAPAQLHVDVRAAELMTSDAAELAKVNAAVKRAASRRNRKSRRKDLEQL